jgi:ATP synthase protein I
MTRTKINYVTWLQLFVTFIVVLISYTVGKVHALSALLGGFICILPTYYFVRKTLAETGAKAAHQAVNALYKGEMIKLGLTSLLFALVFIYVKPLEPLTLLIAFIVVQMTGWFSFWNRKA